MKPDIAAVNSPSAEAPNPLRLQLSPGSRAEPVQDGAWWPRSPVLTAELPMLLAALSERLGPIALVGYHREAWDPAPDCLDRAGHVVDLVGFGSADPPTVIVIGDTGRGVSLRVVPSETDSASAEQALTTAAHQARGPVDNADAAEKSSLNELVVRLSRLTANTDPELTPLISRWVDEAAEQFSDAPVQSFVPILVEHIVRGRLRESRANCGPS